MHGVPSFFERHRGCQRFSVIAAVILGLLISPGCYASDENEPIPPRNGIFVEAKSDCTLFPQKIVRRHIAPGEQVLSRDDRWVAVARPDASQHLIELFDRQTETKITFHHPNIEVMLMDLAFSADSRTLTFVGTPWGVHGISEIFVVDLPTLEVSRFGETGRDYRFPIVINPQKEMIFLESKSKLFVQGKTLLELASHESLAYYIGFRSVEGGVRYLFNVANGATGDSDADLHQVFAPYRRTHKDFLEVAPHPAFGVIAGPGPNQFIAYDAMARRKAGDAYQPLKSGKIVVDLSDAAKVKVTVENVDFRNEVDRLGSRIWIKASTYALEMETSEKNLSMCLEVANIQ